MTDPAAIVVDYAERENPHRHLVTTFNATYCGFEDESFVHAEAQAESLNAWILTYFGKDSNDCDFGCEWSARGNNDNRMTVDIDFDRDKLRDMREASRLLDQHTDERLTKLVEQLHDMAATEEKLAEEACDQAEKDMNSFLFYDPLDVPFDIDEGTVYAAAQDEEVDPWDAVHQLNELKRELPIRMERDDVDRVEKFIARNKATGNVVSIPAERRIAEGIVEYLKTHGAKGTYEIVAAD